MNSQGNLIGRKSDKLKFVGQIASAALCAMALLWVGPAQILAQNPAPNPETLKKANTRPAEPTVPKADPFGGGTVEKMAGQCVTLDTESGAIVIEMMPTKAR